MGKVIEAKTRFTDKKDMRYLEIIEDKTEFLTEWFEQKWPDVSIRIFVVFSRNVAEPLEVAREILCQTNNGTKITLSSVTTIGRNTWHIPKYMESALAKFVPDQMRKINSIMNIALNTKGTANAE